MTMEATLESDGNVEAAKAPLNDAALATLSRKEALHLDREQRMRWFWLRQVMHDELAHVSKDLEGLLDPNNDTKIIAIIGPTGIGKTTLATTVLNGLVAGYSKQRLPHEVPVVYVTAPANGEKSMSWKVLYRRILTAVGDKYLDYRRHAVVKDGEIHAVRADRAGLAHMREALEIAIKERNVRVIVIDESLHLLRFDQNAAIMDTLKSLADIHHTKLVLIGTYQIAPLMIEYGQLARRSAILHYRRYKTPAKNDPSELAKVRASFSKAVSALEDTWPCEEAPPLSEWWEALMHSSLGSVGLLKSQLLQLASLQMNRRGERFDPRDVRRAFKPPRQLQMIEAETVAGERELEGACYGDADLDLSQFLAPKVEGIKGS